jgi:hypothetical protein
VLLLSSKVFKASPPFLKKKGPFFYPLRIYTEYFTLPLFPLACAATFSVVIGHPPIRQSPSLISSIVTNVTSEFVSVQTTKSNIEEQRTETIQILGSILDVMESQGFLHPELLNFFRIQMVFESLNRDLGFQFGCQNKPETKKIKILWFRLYVRDFSATCGEV